VIGGAGAAALVFDLLWPAATPAAGSALRLHPVLDVGHQGLVVTGSF